MRAEIRDLIVIALLANGEGDGKTVARRRKRAGGVRRVSARRIFEAVEIEDEVSGFVESIGGKRSVEKTARAVGSRSAGGVAEDEEKFGDSGIFEDGFEAERFSVESKFGGSWYRLIVIGADESGKRDGFWRGIGNPLGGDAIRAVGRIQLESVKTDDAGRMRILDAQGEAGFAADDVHVESADREMRGDFVVVGFGAESLRLRGSSRN